MRAINLFIDWLVDLFVRKQIEKHVPPDLNDRDLNLEYDRQQLERIYHQKSSKK